MKFFKKSVVLPSVIVTIAVVLCIVIVHFTGSNPVTSAIRSVFAPFQYGVEYISARVSSLTDFIWEAQSYKELNNELSSELTELKRQNMDAARYRQENERLKDLLDLKNDMTDYNTVAASVIAYSSNNWYDTVEINKGTADGISAGCCVLSGDGAVGRVVSAGKNWATVSTVINTGSATGVRVTRTGDIGVVEGDGELCMQGLCKVSFIDNNNGLIAGDLLETSGSGGIYPEGYVVGRIIDVKTDNTGHLVLATVEPVAELDRLREVLVVLE